MYRSDIKRRRKQIIYMVSCPPLFFVVRVNIDIKSGINVAMTKPILNNSRFNSGVEKKAGMAMTKIMKTDTGKTMSISKRTISTRKSIWIHGRAIRATK